MFKPLNYERGKVLRLPMTGSAGFTKYQLVKMSSGYLADAAGGDSEVEYIALETVTDATTNDAGTYCDVIPVAGDMRIEALCVTTPVQASHVGNDYDLAGVSTLDLTATTDKVFRIDEIKNASDKLVIGRFNKPALA